MSEGCRGTRSWRSVGSLRDVCGVLGPCNPVTPPLVGHHIVWHPRQNLT